MQFKSISYDRGESVQEIDKQSVSYNIIFMYYKVGNTNFRLPSSLTPVVDDTLDLAALRGEGVDDNRCHHHYKGLVTNQVVFFESLSLVIVGESTRGVATKNK